jgi:catechol 2,3-dioxygenase-like lactoylglutathione lyase family enzyme
LLYDPYRFVIDNSGSFEERPFMNITGPEHLIMGVEDLAECRKFLTLYGLSEREHSASGAEFAALDGSGVSLRLANDPSLPAANIGGPTLRAAVWGVQDAADLDAIAAELSKDRPVVLQDGVLTSHDDDRNALYFRVSQRRPFDAKPAGHEANVPGLPPRRINQRVSFDEPHIARQMGHVVYWTRDPKEAVKFYRDRLGFRITDSFRNNMGVFARARDHGDHHSLFLMQHGEIPPSFQHAEFTFGDAQEVMAGGYRLSQAGYDTAFGPGRFELGSNWFWYLKTPMGGAFELGADMDHIDDDWVAGEFDHPGVTGGWHFKFDKQWSRQR